MDQMIPACVIDEKGNYVDSVLVEKPPVNSDGEHQCHGFPHGYTLKDSESLIYVSPPPLSNIVDDKQVLQYEYSMLKPRWNGEGWEESATLEEIEGARLAPMEQQPQISEIDTILLAIDDLYKKISGGVV